MARKVACKSEALFPVITSLLEDGSDVKLTITGNSMFPLLRHKVDSVLLRQTSSLSDIFEGDIVLVQREVGRYVLHRVVAKQAGMFSIAGDAQTWIEGPLQQDHLLGVVTSITRGGWISPRIPCYGKQPPISTKDAHLFTRYSSKE